MSRVTATVDIDAPPERVWEVIADPNNLPRWDRRIHAVEGVPADGLKPGSTYTTEIRVMGVRARVDAFVREIRPPEYAEIELTGAPLRATVYTTLTPLEGGRSRLVQDVEYHVRGGQLGEALGRALEHLGAATILRRGTEAQREQVEETARRDAAGEHGW